MLNNHTYHTGNFHNVFWW